MSKLFDSHPLRHVLESAFPEAVRHRIGYLSSGLANLTITQEEQAELAAKVAEVRAFLLKRQQAIDDIRAQIKRFHIKPTELSSFAKTPDNVQTFRTPEPEALRKKSLKLMSRIGNRYPQKPKNKSRHHGLKLIHIALPGKGRPTSIYKGHVPTTVSVSIASMAASGDLKAGLLNHATQAGMVYFETPEGQSELDWLVGHYQKLLSKKV